MSKQDKLDKIQALVNTVKYTMLTTRNADNHLHACPMNTIETSIGAKEIWFIGHNPSDPVDNMKTNPEVNLAYTSEDNKKYLSITGTAELVEDNDKLDELWSPMYNAFFKQGKQDPEVQLIKVIPHGAEYWDNGNVIANMVKISAAAATDAQIDKGLGETFSVDL